jgi:hypothetical protein
MIQMVRLPGRRPETPSEMRWSAIFGGEPESKSEKG